MKLLALLAVLALEQLRPLHHDNWVHLTVARVAGNLDRRFNGGEYGQGVTAWLLAVLPWVLGVQVVNLLLSHTSVPAFWLWNVAVLYFTVGLRRFSHYFTQIADALRDERLDVARDQLGTWRGLQAPDWESNDIARVSIELAFIASHRHFFGTVAWFVAAGAPGAVLYRLSAMLVEQWGGRADAESGAFGKFSEQCFLWLDWLPARLTAASFAIVGNFEDAVYCWRTQAASWASPAQDIILAAGGGALGVRLGGALHENGGVQLRADWGVGDEADADHMRSAVGMIWRALVLWICLILVVSVAHALG